MAGPKIPWRPGRIDGFSKDVTPDGRLPDATQGADHLRHVRNYMFYLMTGSDCCTRSSTAWGIHIAFYCRSKTDLLASFNDQEIVALSGAHALGRCHTDR